MDDIDKQLTRDWVISAINAGDITKLDNLLSNLTIRNALTYSIQSLPVAAAECGHLHILKYLLTCPHFKKEDQFRPTITPAALSAACENGHLEIIKYIVEESPLDQRLSADNCLKIAYSAALGSNQVDAAIYLLTRPDIIDFVDLGYSQNNLLMSCVHWTEENFETLYFLLEPHKKIEESLLRRMGLIDFTDKNTQIILFKNVCKSATTDLLTYVLEKGFITQPVSSLLSIAIDRGEVKAFNYLIETSPYKEQIKEIDMVNCFVEACVSMGGLGFINTILSHPEFCITNYKEAVEAVNRQPHEEIKILFEQAQLNQKIKASQNKAEANNQFKI